MSFNKKSTALAASLLLAISTTLTGCFGSSDTASKVTEAGKDAAGKMAEAGKDAAAKVTDAGKDAAGKMTDAAGKATEVGKDAAGKATEAGKDAAGKMTDAAGKAVEGATGGGLTKLVTDAKVPLVAVNSAVKKGDMAEAKTKFEAFEKVWTVASPQLKTLAGDKFAAIETGVEAVKSAVTGASPDKAKAGEALTSAIKLMDGLVKK